MLWRRTWVRDPHARALADRHYNRRSVGAAEFCPPGVRLVLVTAGYRALWVSHRAIDPRYRADRLDAWFCTTFRNESSRLASVLIRQAIEATLDAWSDVPIPPDGFMTYIDERKVACPSGGLPYGWTFRAVGFEEAGRTRARDLLRLRLAPERLAAFVPRAAPFAQGAVQLRLGADL